MESEDAFEEFFNIFEARFTGNRDDVVPLLPQQRTLDVTEEGLVQAPPMKPRIPRWLRFKKMLPTMPGVKRYRSDLALAFRQNESGVDVLVVPRFKFRFEEGRKRATPRLFNSNFTFATGFKGKGRAQGSDHHFFLNGDEILEPFVVKPGVPLNAFQKNPDVRADDVVRFYYGFIQFRDHHPQLSKPISKKFVDWTCRLYFQQALEVHEKVEAFTGPYIGTRGWINSTEGPSCWIQVEGQEALKEIDVHNLQRLFQGGDHVKVHFTDLEPWRGEIGLVVKLEGELVMVQHMDNTNPEVSDLYILQEGNSKLPYPGNLPTLAACTSQATVFLWSSAQKTPNAHSCTRPLQLSCQQARYNLWPPPKKR
jgi:hypothetical protein